MANDSNIMTVNQYIPGASKDSTRQQIGSFVDVQTVVDWDSQHFKYTDFNDATFFFQDPLFPSFDIVLDTTNSPLLIDDTTYTKNCAMKFLWDYSGIYSVGRRQSVYDEFIKTLYSLFNTNFNQLSRNKSYYINSISGLDRFTARIVDFEKDKITINLNEDVSMVAAYLAHLYNNLCYSYKDQKYIIPYNLLRFNMYIRIQDIRNMPFYVQDGTGTTTYFDKSYQIYLLKDCMFDFKKSKDFEDNITIAGFDAGSPAKPASISIDVVYKSIEIESGYPIIKNYLVDKKSSAFILNNKRSEIYVETDPYLNEVFHNQGKSPDALSSEIEFGRKLNNGGISAITGSLNNLTNLTPAQKNQAALNNYRFGTVSSDTASSNRISDLMPNNTPSRVSKWTQDVNFTGNGSDPTWNNANSTSLPRIILKKKMRLNPNNVDPTRAADWEPSAYPTEAGGTPSWTWTTEDMNKLHTSQLSNQNLFVYEPSVDSQMSPNMWNFNSDFGGKPQTGPGLTVWRDSILGEINLYNFLYNLPINIINRFFGVYGGLPPMYINTFAKPIPTLDEVLKEEDGRGPRITEPPPPPQHGFPPDPDEPGEKYIPGSVPGGTFSDPTVLDGEFIPFAIRPPFNLDGATINATPGEQQYLDGEFIPFAIPFPEGLNGETISYTIPPDIGLNGETIPYTIPPDIGLNGEFIPYAISPKIPLEGTIDTSFTPRGPLEGVIDTSFTPRPPLEGYIDMPIKPRIPMGGRIDTTIRSRIFDLDYVYHNSYEPRIVDLGILYAGMVKDHTVPVTYLYSKVSGFKSPENYYVYNNLGILPKSLENLKIDQTTKKLTPFDLIYEYDNNVDIVKTLNNAILYNNEIERKNALEVSRVIGIVPLKPEFEKTFLYEKQNIVKIIPTTYVYNINQEFNMKKLDKEYLYKNVISEKILEGQTIESVLQNKPLILNLGSVVKEEETENVKINLGKIDQPVKIKKLLEPEKLYGPVKQKVINMGYVYENEAEKNNIFLPKTKKEQTEEKEPREVPVMRIEQARVIQKPMPEININEKEESEVKEKAKLKGDNVNKNTRKKEKEGLNNERLR